MERDLFLNLAHFANSPGRVFSSFHARTNLSDPDRSVPEVEPPVTLEEYKRIIYILESQIEQLKQNVHKYEKNKQKLKAEIDSLTDIPKKLTDLED